MRSLRGGALVSYSGVLAEGSDATAGLADGSMCGFSASPSFTWACSGVAGPIQKKLKRNSRLLISDREGTLNGQEKQMTVLHELFLLLMHGSIFFCRYIKLFLSSTVSIIALDM